MRTQGDINRTNKSDPNAKCTDKGLSKASDNIYPQRENPLTMFTENYYEAIGGYIALMANENYPELFDAARRQQ